MQELTWTKDTDKIIPKLSEVSYALTPMCQSAALISANLYIFPLMQLTEHKSNIFK
jgi:hypothetical protein